METVQPDLPRMAVFPYSSDVLCVHKTRLQLLCKDVQQLKMVQMVAQSPLFCDIYPIGLLRFPFFHNKLCEILIKNFAHIDNSKLNYQYVSSICINSARTLASRSNSRVIVRS